jgi:kynurenine formamidase
MPEYRREVANTGTYVDSPRHRFRDGADLAALDLEFLADPAGVVVRAESRKGHGLGRGIPIAEHLCNLGMLPDGGFRFHATPVKVNEMGSFPVRAYAVVA